VWNSVAQNINRAKVKHLILKKIQNLINYYITIVNLITQHRYKIFKLLSIKLFTILYYKLNNGYFGFNADSKFYVQVSLTYCNVFIDQTFPLFAGLTVLYT